MEIVTITKYCTMIYEDEHTLNIDKSQFEKLFTPNIRKVIHVVREYGFDIRVIGGAVRDFLRGSSPNDVDFATDADPSELIYIFQLEGIDYDAKGIGHGTVKAKFDEDKIDVTSISYKIDLDDKTITVKRGMKWEQDAMSRDLTINSISLDLNGVIHDYVDGLEDLKNQVVRFNPGIIDNFENDPHLIMRWFRALGYFEDPSWFNSDWEKVKKFARYLKNIKTETKTEKELTSILRGYNVRTILKMMKIAGVDKYLDLNLRTSR